MIRYEINIIMMQNFKKVGHISVYAVIHLFFITYFCCLIDVKFIMPSNFELTFKQLKVCNVNGSLCSFVMTDMRQSRWSCYVDVEIQANVSQCSAFAGISHYKFCSYQTKISQRFSFDMNKVCHAIFLLFLLNRIFITWSKQ